MLDFQLKPRLPDLCDGNVDGHLPDGQALIYPGLRLPAAFAQDPVPKTADEAIAFGNGDELGGRNFTMNGMVPAQETLEPVDLAGLNVDLRLVMGLKLAELNCLPQILRQRGTQLHVLVKPGTIEDNAPPAFALGLVQRQVGPAKQVGCGVAVSGNHGNPHTRPN